MNFRDFQNKLPWLSKYSDEFERGPAHRHFGHALHHVAKALGKLVELQDDIDHHGALSSSPTWLKGASGYAKYIADLVIIAARLANEFPGGKLDLWEVVRARVEEKNGIVLEPTPVDKVDELQRERLAADRVREECARVVELLPESRPLGSVTRAQATEAALWRERFADAIRARKEKVGP